MADPSRLDAIGADAVWEGVFVDAGCNLLFVERSHDHLVELCRANAGAARVFRTHRIDEPVGLAVWRQAMVDELITSEDAGMELVFGDGTGLFACQTAGGAFEIVHSRCPSQIRSGTRRC